MTTQDVQNVTDEDIDLLGDLTQEEKDLNKKIRELAEKKDLTDDDKSSLGELKKERSTRFQKKIDKLKSEAKLARAQTAEKERELEDTKKRLEERNAKNDEPLVEAKVIKINNKSYYTDEYLSEQIRLDKMTEADAVKHQQSRIKAEAAEEAYQRLKTDQQQETVNNVKQEDVKQVLADYPQFNKNHPDHDPEDPLYKLSVELWQEGLHANPKGLSLSIKRAKQILGINKEGNKDMSEDLNFGSPSSTTRTQKKTDDIQIPEAQLDLAVRTYMRGDLLNPKTGRPYTKNEAIAKAKEAFANRRRAK